MKTKHGGIDRLILERAVEAVERGASSCWYVKAGVETRTFLERGDQLARAGLVLGSLNLAESGEPCFEVSGITPAGRGRLEEIRLSHPAPLDTPSKRDGQHTTGHLVQLLTFTGGVLSGWALSLLF